MKTIRIAGALTASGTTKWSATLLLLALVLLIPTGCAIQETKPRGYGASPAATSLELADKSNTTQPEASAGYYLDAANLAAQTLSQSSGKDDADARKVYNHAAEQLTVLLRSKTEWWNRTQSFHSPRGTYRLRFAPASKAGGIWDPGYVTFFRTRHEVDEKSLAQESVTQGLGGILVGVNKMPDPKKYYYPPVGVSAPVTAILDFARKGSKSKRDVTLALYDPTKRRTARIDGREFPLAADFSAPFAYYPARKDLGTGGMLHPERYMKEVGIYMTQPYDPERIPVLFVHGLGSAPQTWRNMINAIESDARLRGRFQFWVFDYPSGEPPALAGLQLRDNLKGIYRTYPRTKNMVVVAHSLGGLVSQMQVVNTGRVIWDGVFKDKADEFYAEVPADGLLKQCLIYKATPRIEEVVFICTPHYGSHLATGTLANIVIRIIKLPVTALTAVYEGATSSIDIVKSAYNNRIPNSVQGLSPKSPLLISLNKLPIQVPYYSIIGNRGRPGPLEKSSDGIVDYWSSHLPGAQAEVIVPYGHVCLGEPLTISEVSRILRSYLK